LLFSSSARRFSSSVIGLVSVGGTSLKSDLVFLSFFFGVSGGLTSEKLSKLKYEYKSNLSDQLV
jgi:hypothetical protein